MRCILLRRENDDKDTGNPAGSSIQWQWQDNCCLRTNGGIQTNGEKYPGM
ncbi:MAG: hypothetical protein UET88_03535 [Lachnospiraceae bacterium]|nr:hypothetical protein [Lachnospiraceae bacterium]